MATRTSDPLARTVEIRTALVHLSGKSAGMIEVPIFIGGAQEPSCDVESLYLEVEGENDLLPAARRDFFRGQWRLVYFSPHVRQTRQLPRGLQLHWGPSPDDNPCGMNLCFREASREKDSRN